MISKSDNAKTKDAENLSARKALPSWLSIMLIILLLTAISVVYWVRLHQPDTLTPTQTPELLQTQKELSGYFKKHPEQLNLMDKHGPNGWGKNSPQNQ